jgi:hypothetical protein
LKGYLPLSFDTSPPWARVRERLTGREDFLWEEGYVLTNSFGKEYEKLKKD